MTSQIRISEDSTLIKITSEPYVTYSRRGYVPAVNVSSVHSGEEGYLIISAQSLSEPLHQIATKNNDTLTGVILLVRKASKDRMSPYIVLEQN